MPTIRTRAGTVAYQDTGAGPHLVLLPAGAHDRHDWDAVLPAFAQRYRTIALDWPAHGDSPAPDPGWQPSAFGVADLVEDVVSALDLAPLALIGNSVGGFSAARLAIRHPDAVSALVLVAPGGFAAATRPARLFCAAMSRPGFLRAVYPGFARRYVYDRSSFGTAITRAAVATTRRPDGTRVVNGLWRSFAQPEHDLRADAGRIGAPTLVVTGRRDPVVPPGLGRRIATMIPDSRLVELDAGHVPFATRPADFLRTVLPFLEKATARVRRPSAQ